MKVEVHHQSTVIKENIEVHHNQSVVKEMTTKVLREMMEDESSAFRSHLQRVN